MYEEHSKPMHQNEMKGWNWERK